MEKRTLLIVLLVIIILGGIISYNFIIKQSKREISIISDSVLNINIKGFAFSPSDVRIKQGTNVIWTNNDNTPHTITFDNMNSITSDSLVEGQTYSYKFNEKGTFNYHCNFHNSMKGTIIVE